MSRKAGWIVALATVLLSSYQQYRITQLQNIERTLGKEVFRLQAESSKAVAEFRKPLTQAAQPQPESWVAPLMRPQGGSK